MTVQQLADILEKKCLAGMGDYCLRIPIAGVLEDIRHIQVDPKDQFVILTNGKRSNKVL